MSNPYKTQLLLLCSWVLFFIKAEGDSNPEKVSGDKKRAGGTFFAAKCVAAMPQGRAERGGAAAAVSLLARHVAADYASFATIFLLISQISGLAGEGTP